MEDNKTDQTTHTGFTHVPDDHYSEQDQRAIRDMLNHPSTLNLSGYGKTLVVGGAPTQGTFLGMMRNGEFSPSKRLGIAQHPDISFFDANPFERFFVAAGISPSKTPFLETLAQEFVENGRLTIGNFDVKSSNDFIEFTRVHKGTFGLVTLDYMTFHHTPQEMFPYVVELLSERGILFIPTTLVSEAMRAPVLEFFRGSNCNADLLQLDFPIGDESPFKPHEAFLTVLSAEHLGYTSNMANPRAVYYVQKRAAATAAE